jgi:DNA-binding HxlR family transcriptional regulator
MTRYSEYCPIASTVEILGDRWTPLIIREFAVGATGFNDIHRGLPRMSRSLLSHRLRTMERQGLVVREGAERGRAGRYRLTPAGEALQPIVWQMGNWAAEWVFADPRDEECDGLSLMWRMHQSAIPAQLPDGKTCIHLRLTGPGGAEGWLAVDNREATVCRDDPGYDVDLAVEGQTRHLQRWLVGAATFAELKQEGQVRLIGPSRLARAFPTWFKTDNFAEGFSRAREHQALVE